MLHEYIVLSPVMEFLPLSQPLNGSVQLRNNIIMTCNGTFASPSPNRYCFAMRIRVTISFRLPSHSLHKFIHEMIAPIS